VESEPGEGAIFYVSLPCKKEYPAPENQDQAAVKSA
jgi:hypothetical protein